MIIRKLHISEKTQRATDRIITEEVKKPLFYKGLEIVFIDYKETTAWSNFAEVKFKGNDKLFFINLNKLDNEVLK